MATIMMQLFNGISVSSILFMAAIGLAITFGLMGVINMAHGEFIMIGAYTTYVIQVFFKAHVLQVFFDWYIVVALISSFVVAGIFGLVLEKLVISRLYERPEDSLLVTWGVSIILQQLARSIFGAPNVSVTPPSFLENSLKVTEHIQLPYNRLFILLLALVSLFGVYYLLYKTRQGRNINAVMQNREMAAALGINTKSVDASTFMIGSGLAGLAGCALTWIGAIGPNLGSSYIIDAFMAVVVGGAGTIIGAVFGASFIGIGGTEFEFLTSSSIGKVLIFTSVVILLQFRPKGIFARRIRALED
ncbi:urea ABC transporter permease subunit UrtB [Pseudolactococcus chungangensis]|uniref:urea ABC transporter permease subunit UrtB n=1 Tax=Pseudolactococcus chungangensis TaxID=451457 RepID=UPI003FA1BCC9